MLDYTLRLPAKVILCWLILVATPALAQVANLEFVPAAGSFDCGESWVVDLMIDASVTDLHGASLVVEFDDAILVPLTVSAGTLVTGAACPNFFTWLNATTMGDSIAVDLANLGCAVAGPGSILRMTFEGYQQGIAFVRCRSGVLRDSNNLDIPFTCTEASVDYRCPVADEAQAWGAVKASYR